MLQRLAGITAFALALTPVGAGTAQAASRTFIDGAGDVWAAGGPQAPAPASRAPAREQADILRTTFTHGHHRVVMRIRFVELKREGQHIHIFTKLRTNTGEVRTLFVNAAHHNHWRVVTRWETPAGRTVDCALSQTIDYATNVAVTRLPRTCLDNPRTVQATFQVFTGTPRRRFSDNPFSHRPPKRPLPPFATPIRHG